MMLAFVFFVSFSAFANAENGDIIQDEVTTVKAKVLEVLSQEEKKLPGLDVTTNYQTLSVEILEGPKEGKIITVENDYLNLKKGDVFYLNDLVRADDGTEIFSVMEPYRINALIFFTAIFVLLVLIIGGKQGGRGLLSLIGSLGIIFFLLLPGILKGYSPMLLSIGAGSLIIGVGSYITHGFNKTTTVAVIGIILTILITGGLANFAVSYSQLSGFSEEESVYLNLNTNGQIDFAGLLLAGILIGLLGILYDAAIGQAVAVEELYSVGGHLPKKIILQKAMRIGREHIGALVDTLAIAYVGAALPLMLLFYLYNAPIVQTINREIFAAEIIRILIGSIGLILTVPVTTVIAVFLLGKSKLELKQ